MIDTSIQLHNTDLQHPQLHYDADDEQKCKVTDEAQTYMLCFNLCYEILCQKIKLYCCVMLHKSNSNFATRMLVSNCHMLYFRLKTNVCLLVSHCIVPRCCPIMRSHKVGARLFPAGLHGNGFPKVSECGVPHYRYISIVICFLMLSKYEQQKMHLLITIVYA